MTKTQKLQSPWAMLVLWGMLVLASLLILGQKAKAESLIDILDADTSYTANFTISGDYGPGQGQIWHMPGKERRVLEMRGASYDLIIDRAADLVYVGLPARRLLVKLGADAAFSALGGFNENINLGKGEAVQVNGFATTRYPVKVANNHGSFEGSLYRTKSGIVVKIDGQVRQSNGKKGRVVMNVTDLRLIDPVHSTFVPNKAMMITMDLSKVPADGLSEALGGLQGLFK